MRLIDVDAVLRNLPNDLTYKAAVKRVLIQAPTAADNVPILHGRWEKDRDTIKCSVCGFGMFPIKYAFRDGQCVGDSDAHYCPNCGAKMEVATQ